MFHNHSVYKDLYFNEDKFIILVTGGRGCEDPDQLVLMHDGTVRKIQYINVGEYVCGDDYTPRKVLDKVYGTTFMYTIHQSKGDDYTVTDSHTLVLYNEHTGEEEEIPMFRYLSRPWGYKGILRIGKETVYTDIYAEWAGEREYCGLTLDGNHRYLHPDGTVIRNSGKSTALSTFITRLTFELGTDGSGKQISHQILYSRYTMTSAKTSIIPEVEDKIAADGLGKYFSRSGADIVNDMTKSHIMFRGIKTSSGNQTAKLKSIKGLSVFVCDEAEEFVDERDFETIMYSIRQQGLKNLVIIIMNPSDSNHFIYRRYIKDTHKLVDYDGTMVQISTHPNVLHIHTSFLDNAKYLAPQFLEEAKAMKERDPERYGHIFMGRWADVAEGAIFKKWGIVKKFPEYARKVALAMDLGYSQDPTAIVKCGIVDNALYIDEIAYKTGMLSAEIIKTLKENNEQGSLFTYSESADPRLIDEIALGGVVIYPVSKGPGSIMAGIDKMLTMDIFVTERSLNVQNEFRNYVWAKDKYGQFINMPEGGMDHCFVANTLVMTIDGEKPIIDIKVGDMVLTSDGYRRVTKTFDNGYKNTFQTRIWAGGRSFYFEATTDHKIKTLHGWVALQDLMHYDAIFTPEGALPIDRISKFGNYAHVYDIEVEDMHEFYANGILVHNCMDACRYFVLAVLLGKVMKPIDTTKERLGIF